MPSKTRVNIEEAISLAGEGYTLQELGDRYGVSRQRISQIMEEKGIKLERTDRSSLTFAKQLRRAADAASEIVAHFRSGMLLGKLSKKYHLPPSMIRATLKSALSNTEYQLLMRSHWGTHTRKKFSDEKIIHQIQVVSRRLKRTPSSAEWAERSPANYVSSPLITVRFGSWNNAMRAAGLTPNAGTKPGHSQRYTKEDMLDSARECWHELGHLPSAAEYELWRAKSTKRHVSLARIRHKWLWIEVLSILVEDDSGD